MNFVPIIGHVSRLFRIISQEFHLKSKYMFKKSELSYFQKLLIGAYQQEGKELLEFSYECNAPMESVSQWLSILDSERLICKPRKWGSAGYIYDINQLLYSCRKYHGTKPHPGTVHSLAHSTCSYTKGQSTKPWMRRCFSL